MGEKEMLKMSLDSLPTKILEREKLILAKNREADKVELDIKSTESSYKSQIASELEDGKKKFKNEIEREIELKLRLKRNDHYKSNLNKIADLKREIADEMIVVSYLKRRFRATEMIVRLGE